MMIVHLAETRGKADHGWLKSYHTFSFADYYNPERMNFGSLRVINDDIIAAGTGFGRHPHRDMEIITIPLKGAVRHQDSQGNEGVIKKGEIQVMSAGTGIFHSEFSDETQETNLLQIWILPQKLGIRPHYEQKTFPLAGRKQHFQLLVSPDGRDGSLVINQNAFISISDFEADNKFFYWPYVETNGIYFFIMSGTFEIQDHVFHERDGVGFEKMTSVEIKSIGSGEILVLEIPMSLDQRQ
jgi:redox-sensitive bicupin YhaK (pirin superfamily)